MSTPLPSSPSSKPPISFRHYVWQRYFKPFLLVLMGMGIVAFWLYAFIVSQDVPLVARILDAAAEGIAYVLLIVVPIVALWSVDRWIAARKREYRLYLFLHNATHAESETEPQVDGDETEPIVPVEV